jgi:hypothetical protein
MTKHLINTQLSMNELTGRILEMAQTGVYRESLFETFRPMATKREVRGAIALAKQFGLRSDASLRDAELGTYYQVAPDKAQAFQATVQQSIVLRAGDDMARRVQLATQTVKLMLVVSGGGAIALFLLGGGYVLAGRSEAAALWWTSGLCISGVWVWQKSLAKPVL